MLPEQGGHVEKLPEQGGYVEKDPRMATCRIQLDMIGTVVDRMASCIDLLILVCCIALSVRMKVSCVHVHTSQHGSWSVVFD